MRRRIAAACICVAVLGGFFVAARADRSRPGQGGGVSSAAFDALLGSTRGSVIYRGASGWVSLVPATDGQVLGANGVGADPAWTTTIGSASTGASAPGWWAVGSSPLAVALGDIGAGTTGGEQLFYDSSAGALHLRTDDATNGLTFDSDGTITGGSAGGGSGNAGVAVSLIGGAGDGVGAGGLTSLIGGASDTGIGGGITITSGAATGGSGDAGDMNFASGASAGGSLGDANFTGFTAINLSDNAGTLVASLITNTLEMQDQRHLAFGTDSDASISWRTAPTVDNLLIGLSSTGHTLIIGDKVDTGSNRGYASSNTPIVYFVSDDATNPDEHTSISSVDTSSNIGSGKGVFRLFNGTTDTTAITVTEDAGAGATILAPQGVLKLRPGTGQSLQLLAGDGNTKLQINTTGVICISDVSMAFGSAAQAVIRWDTAQTNDSLGIGLFGTSRTLIIGEAADISVDRGLANQATPTTYFWSDAATASEYLAVTHDGTQADISTGSVGGLRLSAAAGRALVLRANGTVTIATLNGSGMELDSRLRMNDDKILSHGSGSDVFQQGESTTLSDNVATTVFSVVSADGDMPGLQISYTIQVVDSSGDLQCEAGTVKIAIVDHAGGVVAGTPLEASVQALEAGTLTSAWTVVTTDDQSIEVQLTANTSLTPGTLTVRWHAIASGDVTLTVP